MKYRNDNDQVLSVISLCWLCFLSESCSVTSPPASFRHIRGSARSQQARDEWRCCPATKLLVLQLCSPSSSSRAKQTVEEEIAHKTRRTVGSFPSYALLFYFKQQKKLSNVNSRYQTLLYRKPLSKWSNSSRFSDENRFITLTLAESCLKKL